MQDKPVALVTGANKGVGPQIAKDLAAHGFTVLVGSRNLKQGEAAARRASERMPAPSSLTSRTKPPSPPRQSASEASSAASTCS